mmetsp:Transcript_54125/g.123325  ORF Transcript_54125/g.123325 Transcript_54125/m.123325 type:complete len:246 (-) Transcript_54125:77-814(-)
MYDHEKPCMAHPMIGFVLALPAGSLAGLVAAAYGFFTLQDPLSKLSDALNDMGLDVEEYLDYFNYVAYAFLLADILVSLYGLREKFRIRTNTCGHVGSCIPCCIKFIFKGFVNLIVVAALALTLVCMVLGEGLYVMCWTIDSVCNTGQMESIEEIMDLLGGSDNGLEQICSAADNAKQGGYGVMISSMILTVAQIIVLAYWMKYSTLAMVPYKYADGDEDLDDFNSSPMSPTADVEAKPTAPRKH